MDTALALIRSGAITADDYVEAVLRREDERPRMGQVAIEEGLLSARQVLDILTRQYAQPERRFGEIAIQSGELDPEQVDALVLAQEARQRSVVDHLIDMGCLDAEEVESAAESRRGERRGLVLV